MRSTDPDPPPWKPLGERVVKPAPAPPQRDTPTSNPSVVIGSDGRMKTIDPPRKETP